MDGFWEADLKPWDIAGGALIVAEAGGRVTDLGGGPFTSRGGHVLATNGHLHDAMLEVIRDVQRADVAHDMRTNLIPARDNRGRIVTISARFPRLFWHLFCYPWSCKGARPCVDSFRLEPGPWCYGLLATPIASAQQSVNFYVGGFTLRGEDARDSE